MLSFPLIFTDLDGSLLNHDDYSFDGAVPSLERISRSRIPLIMATSKTRREVELLQGVMGIREPFIVENGGGIFFPAGYRGFTIPKGQPKSGYTLVRLGMPYSRIRSFFATVRAQFGARGFGDLSVEEVSALTGLSLEQAELAKAREFTEPFLLESDDALPFLHVLAMERQMKITRGGRFYHLIGARQDKGAAALIVRDVFRRNIGDKLISIGIGDSENDLPMLRVVDIPVLIPHPVRGYPDIQPPGLVKAGEPGCRGWNDAVGRILNELKTDDHGNLQSGAAGGAA